MLARASLDDHVSVSAQPAGQQVAVRLDVVDDEDASGLARDLHGARVDGPRELRRDGQVGRIGAELGLVASDVLDQRVNTLQQHSGLGLDGVDVARDAGRQRVAEILRDHLGIAEDGVDRRAQVVAKLRLCGLVVDRRSALDRLSALAKQSRDQRVQCTGRDQHLLEVLDRVLGAGLAHRLDDQLLKAEQRLSRPGQPLRQPGGVGAVDCPLAGQRHQGPISRAIFSSRPGSSIGLVS